MKHPLSTIVLPEKSALISKRELKSIRKKLVTEYVARNFPEDESVTVKENGAFYTYSFNGYSYSWKYWYADSIHKMQTSCVGTDLFAKNLYQDHSEPTIRRIFKLIQKQRNDLKSR